jgi:hypothetical protein
MLLTIDPAELEPIIAATVAATIAAMQLDQDRVGDRMAYMEPEAARLLSMAPHQLRDERLRGRIGASGVVGRGVRYTRDDLLGYLARERTEKRM